MMVDVVERLMALNVPTEKLTQQDYDAVIKALERISDKQEVTLTRSAHGHTRQSLQEEVLKFFTTRYQAYINRDSQEMLNQAQKWIMLESFDTAWKSHMSNLDALKEGIGFRSWGQKNPLIEYKREAFIMFEDMMHQVKAEIVYNIFNLDLQQFDQHALELKRSRELHAMRMMGSDGELHNNDGGHDGHAHGQVKKKVTKKK
jgi:preprotein translocase subunit SecA